MTCHRPRSPPLQSLGKYLPRHAHPIGWTSPGGTPTPLEASSRQRRFQRQVPFITNLRRTPSSNIFPIFDTSSLNGPITEHIQAGFKTSKRSELLLIFRFGGAFSFLQEAKRLDRERDLIVNMVCCLVCDESRKVVGSRPTNGVCSNCGGSISAVRVRSMFRLCFLPVCCSNKNRIICSRCGTQYRNH